MAAPPYCASAKPRSRACSGGGEMKNISPSSPSLWWGRASHALLWLLGLLSFGLIAERVLSLGDHLSRDPNEGWNAFQTRQALSGQALYPPLDGLTGNNYPPLSFYIVGWTAKLTGDPILAGRLLALLSMLTVGGIIVWMIRRLMIRVASPADYAPWLGGLLFMALNATLLRRYVGLDDPQWMADAVMMAGMALILPKQAGESPSAACTVGSALLLLCGGMIKHNLLAAPLAVGIWLLLYHRRAWRIWCITALVGLAGVTVLCLMLYGPDMMRDIVGAKRHLSILRMADKSIVPLLVLLPMLIASRPLLQMRRQDDRLDLILIFVLIALPLGIFQRSGQGVDVNAHIEAAIALCLSVAVSGSASIPADNPWRMRVFIAAPLLIVGLVAIPKIIGERRHLTDDLRAWRSMETRIAAMPGPVACEMPALCFWAGQNFVLDFFLYGQNVALSGDDHLLRKALEDKTFSAIILEQSNHSASAGEIGTPLPSLIGQIYRPLDPAQGNWRIMVPGPAHTAQ
ncbi:Hypothetical protein GbCGDNIH2_0462 [Granulibacter bethesdensis]|uniref:Glycosyltransferase RgtA/B/C/D-like domain-containing protein n=2 Tax=Granulibacter bethesdensis TaxID=364410 RepID=Q0BUZ2_GRABC|nr:Hypothetical protein GbCGDNIH1_0462 [Granulibacter bethesdensis CGDNIH1]AHJ67478.1 Hypothetical protein GbCGDNIH2_0462 [Granulibacter bethesdensis]APH51149.1 Hypothetical protein GbCGDNIH5_0462 [Granulibacter bethesdensis]APH63843.1 Hypothetical protein GbCGDNIH1I4_0462 [Granulibacter bethesdensis]